MKNNAEQLNDSHYIFNEKIKINKEINFHLEIISFNEERFLTHYFKFNSGDLIYQTNLLISKELIDELENKVYGIINLNKEFYYKSKTIFFESINFKKYFDIIKDEYEFLLEIFNNLDSLRYSFDVIGISAGFNEEDIIDSEILDYYQNKEVYKTFQKRLKNNNKLVVDFYKISEGKRGIIYFIDGHIKSKNSYVNVRNKIPAAILFILGFFEYRNFSAGGYLELAENVESILNGENQGYLAGTLVSIEKILDRLDSYIEM